MKARRLLLAGISVLLVHGESMSQEVPSSVPSNFSARSPSIGFLAPGIGYLSPRIQFIEAPMTEDEIAFVPKAPIPTAVAVKGLDVKEVEGGVRYTLSADILFDFDKASLRPKATVALDAMSMDVRQRFESARFFVDGYTDSKGTDSYNLKLSLRRAEAVRNYLADKAKFEAASVSIEGRGEINPVAPNETPDGQDDPEGRQKNRRVEILVKSAN